ncbi:hypothetical protein K439DRAFT_1630394 [Ramaria rubella]|nr:hypothetical protein K439DRAFT_1630394 [Ramaria rubella]
MPLSLDTPLSLYSIPIVWVTAFYPHNKKYRLISNSVGFDNVHPRSNEQDQLTKKGMSKELVDKVSRLTAAHQNGNEAFPLWAAAVLVANQAGIENRTLNIVSVGYISLRLFFNYIYIKNTTAGASSLRTATWFLGLSLPMYLLIKAANKTHLA